MIVARRARAAIVTVVLSGLVVAGCGSPSPSTTTAPSIAPASPAPSAAGPSTPVAGASLPTTGRIAVVDKGYAITLPAGWTRIDLGPDALKEALDAGASALPQDMQAMLGGQMGQLALSGVSVFALRRPEGEIAAGTTLNVLSLPSLGVPLATFESLMISQLKAVGGADTQVASSRVRGPAGEFLRLAYDLKAADRTVATVQYVFTGPTNQYVISCGTPGPVTAVQGECEAIATSLEILP